MRRNENEPKFPNRLPSKKGSNRSLSGFQLVGLTILSQPNGGGKLIGTADWLHAAYQDNSPNARPSNLQVSNVGAALRRD